MCPLVLPFEISEIRSLSLSVHLLNFVDEILWYLQEEKSRQRAMGLLLQRGADPNLQDDYGRTALSYACELRHNDVVKLLMKWNIDPDLPDAQGEAPKVESSPRDEQYRITVPSVQFSADALYFFEVKL